MRRLRVPALPEEEVATESNDRGSLIPAWFSATNARRPRLRVEISSDDDEPDGSWGAGGRDDSSGHSDEAEGWAAAPSGRWHAGQRRRRTRLVRTGRVKTEPREGHCELEQEDVDAAFARGGSGGSDSDSDGSGVSTADDEEVLAWGEVGDVRPPATAAVDVGAATPHGGDRRRRRRWGTPAQVAAALRSRGRRGRRLQCRMRRDGTPAQADTSGEATFPSNGPTCLRMILAAVVTVTTPPGPAYAGLGAISRHLRLGTNGSKYKAAHQGLCKLVAYGALVTAPNDWAPSRARTSEGARRAYATPPEVDPALLDAVCDGRVLSPEGQLLDDTAGRALVRSRMPSRPPVGARADRKRRPRRPRQRERDVTSDGDSGDGDDEGHGDHQVGGYDDGGGSDCGGDGGGQRAVCGPPSPRIPSQAAVDGGRLASAYSLGAALAAAMAIVGKSGGVVQPLAQPAQPALPQSLDRPSESAGVEPPPPAQLLARSDERLLLPPPLESIALPQAADTAADTAAQAPWYGVDDGNAAGTKAVAAPPRPLFPRPSARQPGRWRFPSARPEQDAVFAAAAARLLRHPRLEGHTYADLAVAVAAAEPGGPPPPPPPSKRFPDAIPTSYFREQLVAGVLAAGPPALAWRPADVMWMLFVPSYQPGSTDRQRAYSLVWLPPPYPA